MSDSDTSKISLPAAGLAVGAAVAALLSLASLHWLSPEFAPSWRMVSEYANGRYGWVLSVMFAMWALSSWALAYAIWSQVRTRAGKVGLFFLTLAGIGEAMAAVFDLNQAPHELAGAFGILGLPIAAMLISVSLGRTQPWSEAKKALLWTANLTWVSLALLVASFGLMVATFLAAGGDMAAPPPKVLPAGVIGMVGWANRLLVLTYCVWAITIAWQAIRLRRQAIETRNYGASTQIAKS